MGRIRAWTLLSKAIVAGFLCWLQSPNTLCFAVRVAFWCLDLLLGLADLIYIIFLCCGTSSDLPFFSGSSVTFLTFPGDHLLQLQHFGPSVIAESRLRVPLFAVPALKHRQFILGSSDFQFLSFTLQGKAGFCILPPLHPSLPFLWLILPEARGILVNVWPTEHRKLYMCHKQGWDFC